jgi:hypothetical protein
MAEWSSGSRSASSPLLLRAPADTKTIGYIELLCKRFPDWAAKADLTPIPI